MVHEECRRRIRAETGRELGRERVWVGRDAAQATLMQPLRQVLRVKLYLVMAAQG